MKKVCMVVQDPMVQGGIAAVVNGYRGSKLEKDYDITYVESYKDGGKFTKLFKAISGYLKFLSVITFNKPDVVHIHSSFGPSFFRKIPFIYMASFKKIPIINHIHGSEFGALYLDAGEKKQKLVKKVWDKCDRFIVLSDEWKETFICVIPKEKMTVIENYSQVIDEFNFKKGNNQILFLGAINEMKGCFDMPQVIAEVKKQVPDVKMVVAGSGEIDEVKKRAQALGVLDNFSFPGWVRKNKKAELLSSSDIFFLPSYTEGMPMSILDAMGYGLPIISTVVGGIPKIVKNDENGYILNPGDCDGFAQRIIDVLKDDSKRESFASESYNVAKSRYSLDIHIKAIEKLYDELSK